MRGCSYVIGQYETSEDSASQTTSSVVGDESAPILGRRAEREHAGSSRLSDSDFSDDSDWPPFKVTARLTIVYWNLVYVLCHNSENTDEINYQLLLLETMKR